MTYVFDTDVVSFCELPDSFEYRRIHARAIELSNDDRLVTTIISYEEQTRGWLAYAARAKTTQQQVLAYTRLKKHLRNYLHFEVLDFDSAAAAKYDQLRSMKLGTGSADLKIAAIAISTGAVVITRNLRDFQRVPGLAVEDWTR